MNRPGNETDSATDADAKALAKRLREARGYVGLSQEMVAEHLGVPRPAISAMEHGIRKVSSLELKGLAALYRRSPDFFLGTNEKPELVLGSDSFTEALFRATQALDDFDRDQVLRFAEFLSQGPPPHHGNNL